MWPLAPAPQNAAPLMCPYRRTPAGQQPTAAADARASPPPQANVAWTPPAGQPPLPNEPPPAYPAPQPTPSQGEDQQSAAQTATQPPLPPGPPPPLSPPPPRQPPPPRASSNHAGRGNGGAEHARRSWPDDNMDLDDARTPSPRQPPPAHAASHRDGGGAGNAGALPPPQPPPPQLPPPMVPTMNLAPAPASAAPAPTAPQQQQVFAPPVFNPNGYAQAGAATAAATASPVVVGTSSQEFSMVPGGVVLRPSVPPAASTAGTAPVSVMLPLGSVPRPPAIITTTAPAVPAGSAGPPLFSPQELDHALAIRRAAETLAARRQNPAAASAPPAAPATPAPPAPPAPPGLTYISENHAPHPGSQPFQPRADQARERQGSHDRDGSQHRGSPPPPYGW